MKTNVALWSIVLFLGITPFFYGADSTMVQTSLFANLGAQYYNPDGMTIGDKSGILYLNVPNFSRMDKNNVKADSAQGGYLLTIAKDGTATRVLEYPVHPVTGQCGPMGLDCGPDGHLYVCDNQYFHTKNNCSRILRVVLNEKGIPTGQVETVVEGFKLANGIVWSGRKMFYTDSAFDLKNDDPNIAGYGGVFVFDAAEVLKAGRNGAPAIHVKSSPNDPHCLAFEKVVKLGRGDGTGCDGITVDKNGVVWFGNFGNGFLYGAWPNEKGEYKRENVCNVFDALHQIGCDFGPWQGIRLECCDGICYDPGTKRIIIDDSVNNAIWAFAPCKKGGQVKPFIVLKNGDTDGNKGELDQPCEAVLFDGKIIFANFDWPFPGLLNSKVDPPGTLSFVPYAKIKPLLIGK